MNGPAISHGRAVFTRIRFFKGSSNLLDKVRSNELLNVIFWLGNLPPVDSVEVVRCICCKYYGEDIFERGGYCKKHKLDCDDFDFCSRGEKK